MSWDKYQEPVERQTHATMGVPAVVTPTDGGADFPVTVVMIERPDGVDELGDPTFVSDFSHWCELRRDSRDPVFTLDDFPRTGNSFGVMTFASGPAHQIAWKQELQTMIRLGLLSPTPA